MDNNGGETVNLQEATPVEIDTELARIHGEIAQARAKRDHQWSYVQHAVKTFLGLRWDQEPTADQIRETCEECVQESEGGVSVLTHWNTAKVAAAVLKYEELCEAVDSLWFETQPYSEEFNRRGGWTRAFLVVNTNGHVHSSMYCTTCFETTQYAWLPQYSGKAESEIVEDAGERACTVCYPSAPAEVLNRPTKIFSEAEKAAQTAREERAAAKEAREAKRLEKALLPSGETARVTTNHQYGWVEKLSTLASAKQFLTNAYDYRSYPQESVKWVVEAVAAKEGKSVDTVIEEAQKRAAKRR